MYEVYIDGTLLPVTPEKLEIKTKGNSDTITLMNGGEINIPAPPGLLEVSFKVLLPNRLYPFARYPEGFRFAWEYVEKFWKLLEEGIPFQFIVFRELPDKTKLAGSNIKVTMEDASVEEDAKNGTDVLLSITLRQYRSYGTKKVMLGLSGENTEAVTERETKGAPETGGKSYTVQKGDCLWNIAKKFYGNGADYGKIANANRESIKNPNLIYPGQLLIIP